MLKKAAVRIVLIGYRGSGKSTVGQGLAKKLSLPLVDTDILIEEKVGKTIKEMVKEKGWPYFRAIEKDVIRNLRKDKGTIIAVGGGAILDPENRMCLKENSLVFYLAADKITLSRRIIKDTKTDRTRPSLTGEEVTAEIASVLKEREPFYRQAADYVVDTEERTVDKVIEEIISIVETNKSR